MTTCKQAEFAHNTHVHSSNKQTTLFLADGSEAYLPARDVRYLRRAPLHVMMGLSAC